MRGRDRKTHRETERDRKRTKQENLCQKRQWNRKEKRKESRKEERTTKTMANILMKRRDKLLRNSYLLELKRTEKKEIKM